MSGDAMSLYQFEKEIWHSLSIKKKIARSWIVGRYTNSCMSQWDIKKVEFNGTNIKELNYVIAKNWEEKLLIILII